MDKFYREIGKRMKSVRMALKMTQAQVAEKACIDPSFYGQIERGANVPSLKTFVAIARALKVNSSDLLPQSGKEKLYEKAVENILTGLPSKKRAAILSLVRDIAAQYRAKP